MQGQGTHGEIHLPFLGKVYDQFGSVFGHKPSDGLALGNATFAIEAAPFSGVLQVANMSYSIPETPSTVDAVVNAVGERRLSPGGSKVADAKLLAALTAAIGSKGR